MKIEKAEYNNTDVMTGSCPSDIMDRQQNILYGGISHEEVCFAG